jgi:pimeloyl-ACP methyl ester carboxylesterase
MKTERTERLVPVLSIDRRVPVASGDEIAVTVFVPERVDDAKPVLFLFPGGGASRRYFDLGSEDPQDHGQARWHAERGVVTVTVDHLGTGESTVPADGVLLGGPPRDSAEDALGHDRLAAAGDAAVRAILAELERGGLAPGLGPIPDPLVIGAGHSAGGHMVAVMQAHHATFRGIAALGSSFTSTRLRLRPGRHHPYRALPASVLYTSAGLDADMEATAHWRGEAEQSIQASADRSWRTKNIPLSITRLMEPYVVAREAAAVRVPVLLVYGEQDVTVEPLQDIAVFRSAPDVATAIIPRMAHMHNFAQTRALAWARLQAFVHQVAAVGDLAAAAETSSFPA